MNLDRRQSRRYLLIGSPPTPNGRAHLGHVAGPFLRLDVLARHHSVLGDEAVFVSGSDSYDMFVLLTARKEGAPPEQVARRYHAAMEADLRSLDIGLAAFVDPMNPRWSAAYQELLATTTERLIAAGRTERRRERVLYAPSTGRYIVGCWLLGRCPGCGCEAGSYFCEGCGAFFRPELIRDPRPRFDEGSLESRQEEILYLRGSAPSRLLDTWEAMGIPAVFQIPARRFIAEHGVSFPITQPGTWGVPWRTDGQAVSQVIFSYAALHPYLLLLGAEYGSVTGRQMNAFDPAAGVTSVVAFGIDNVIPYLVPTVGVALEDARTKPSDHYLINYFYELEGAKFSTSRGHVIWGLDIVTRTPAGSDAVRCYLAKVNPERGPASFDIEDFVGFVNAFLAGRLDARLHRRWPQAVRATPSAPPGELVRKLGSLLEARAATLDLRRFKLSGSLDQLDEWLGAEGEVGDGDSAAYWWLKGLSLLAYPLMPKLGAALWSALGHPGTPTLAAFGRTSTVSAGVQLPRFNRLTALDLAPCLPQTLQREPMPAGGS